MRASKGAGARTSAGKEGLRPVRGQLQTEAKSNQRMASPLWLELLALKGWIVPIAARGGQTELAAQVIAQEADYVLSLKGNQGTLSEEVAEYFAWAEQLACKDLEDDYRAPLEKEHGRSAGRRCWVPEETDWFTEQAEWAGLALVHHGRG